MYPVSIPNIEIYSLSQEEVIKILEENGIQVVMKPMALLPDNLIDYNGISRPAIGTVLTDIYVALERLNTRLKIQKDPFEDKNIY